MHFKQHDLLIEEVSNETFNEYGSETVLYEKTASADFVFGHTGNNFPAVNTIVLINPDTNDAIIIASTGGIKIASVLGKDWITWELN